MPDLTLPERKLAGLQLIPAADDQLESGKFQYLAETGFITETSIITTADEVEAMPLRWLWKEHIPSGYVTLLTGADGAGKSLIALDLAARVSSGRHWPGQADSEDPPLGEVLIACPPHEAADVVVPRLKALGADTGVVRLLQGARRTDRRFPGGERRRHLFPEDIVHLEGAIARMADVELVIVDPLQEFCPDARREAETIRLLEILAEKYCVAIVVVTRAVIRRNRMTEEPLPPGNRAFALLPAIWTVGADVERDERGEFCPARLNFCQKPAGFAFRIDGGLIRWEPLERTRRKSETAEAAEWLLAQLGRAEVSAKQIRLQAAECGITQHHLRRARLSLGIELRKTGFAATGEWHWSLAGGEIAGAEGEPQIQVEEPTEAAERARIKADGGSSFAQPEVRIPARRDSHPHPDLPPSRGKESILAAPPLTCVDTYGRETVAQRVTEPTDAEPAEVRYPGLAKEYQHLTEEGLDEAGFFRATDGQWEVARSRHVTWDKEGRRIETLLGRIRQDGTLPESEPRIHVEEMCGSPA